MKKNLKRLALLWLFPALSLPGIFAVLASLLWGTINVSAGTAVKVGTILAANQFFVNPEQELNTYLTRVLLFQYFSNSSGNGVTTGYVTGGLDGAYYDPPYYKVFPVIAPGVYNFHITYSIPGTERSDPITWHAFIRYDGLTNYMYIYHQPTLSLMLNFGETSDGTIIVDDVGQTTKLEKVAGDNQSSYSGIQFPEKLIVKAIRNDGQLISGRQIGVSLKSAPPGGQAVFANPTPITGVTGSAETSFTLTGPVGQYVLSAYCNECAQQKEVTFTETVAGDILLKIPDGDNQTWLVGQPLPKGLNVRVVNSETDAPVPNKPVTFAMLAPANGASLSTTSINPDLNGYATTYLTLGTSTGTYRVRAACLGCAAGVNEVTFTAKAVSMEETTEIRCLVPSHLHGVTTKRLGNPFVAGAYNIVTRKYENFQIGYDVHSFVNKEGVPTFYIPNGTQISAVQIKKQKDNNYYAYSYLTLGNEEGTYLVKVSCPNCFRQPEAYCYGHARLLNIPSPELETNTAANPNDRAPNGRPYTPVLRITKVVLPNNTKSFTTYIRENAIHMEAQLLPTDYYGQNLITWTLEDEPNDGLNSGSPAMTSNTGPNGDFNVNQSDIPPAPTGRPEPLNYRTFVTADILGAYDEPVKLFSRSVSLRQDEIDKCRQEYFDLSVPGKDLSLEPYFGRFIRSKFKLGIDAKYVKYTDCFAYIYPETKIKILDIIWEQLKNELTRIEVTSGYRSARHNKINGGVWNSAHIFGEALDTAPIPLSGESKENLWNKTPSPRLLENANDKTKPILLKDGESSSGIDVLPRNNVSDEFDKATHIHLGE
ncbi:MAG: hypothetical protein A2X34_01415 [Elusimicrobia bacterium GWC2_51_8]|nr:MAG: hypothetical protein A2X34_01415 [Elusimicrobia bacterium GWC2_51_8]OGR88242.1 MAG: hypothetical protein A2021_04905 [Elusimicrobia bacterium GWF2_52_66]